MQKVVVDCAAKLDASGRAVAPSMAYVDLTQAEINAYNALQLTVGPIDGVSHCAGRVVLVLLDGVTKAVTFAKVMRSSDYVVTLQPTGSLAASLWTSSHTTTGFTVNLSAAISGTVEYIAHEVT